MIWSPEDLDNQIAGTPFTWRKALTQGSTGIIATPTPEQMDNIVKQANALVKVFRLFQGFTITSWLRTPEHNSAIGGAPHSAHLLGLATDFIPTKYTIAEAKSVLKFSRIYPGGMELDTDGWIHLDLVHKSDFYAKPRG